MSAVNCCTDMAVAFSLIRPVRTAFSAAALLGMAVAAAAAGVPAATSPSGATSAAPSSAPPASGLFAVTPVPPCPDPMCYWANSNLPGVPSLRVSRTNMVMINPDIVDTTRGISHITADRADESGPSIGDSQWVLTGHVRADMAQGQLRCDTATIRIVDSRIASITTHGSPALFQRPATNPPTPPASSPHTAGATGATGATGAGEQKADMSSVTVRGHAQSITYDAVHDQVQFSGDSWFTDGCNEITSQLVTYNMVTQLIQASATPGSNARVHGTIRNTHPGTPCAAGTAPP